MSVTVREVVTTVEVLDRNRVSVIHGTPVSPGANYATLTTAQTITGAKTFNAGALLVKGPVSSAGEASALTLRTSAADGGSAGNSTNAIWFGNWTVRFFRNNNKAQLDAYDGMQIQGESAANPGIVTLIVKGVSGQTGNLQQWQNSAGTALTIVDASGNAIVRKDRWGAGGAQVGGLNAPQGFFGIGASSVEVILAVRGVSGQIGDLTQWQDSSAGVLAKVTSDGRISVVSTSSNAYFESPGSNHFGYSGSPTTKIAVRTAATNIGLVVQGFASQSADLQQWQNSAGTALGNMTAGGKMRSKEFELLGADAGITLTTTGWQTNKVVSPGGTPTVFNFAQLTLGTAAIFYIANNHNSGINLYTVFVQYSTNGKMIAIQDANEPYSPANLTFALDNATGIVSVTASYSAGMWVKADVFFGTVTEL